MTVDYTNVSDKDILNTILTQEIGLSESASFNNKDKQAFMKGNEIGVYSYRCNDKLVRLYSEVVPVDVSF